LDADEDEADENLTIENNKSSNFAFTTNHLSQFF
jgi:hypothetical protein